MKFKKGKEKRMEISLSMGRGMIVENGNEMYTERESKMRVLA